MGEENLPENEELLKPAASNYNLGIDPAVKMPETGSLPPALTLPQEGGGGFNPEDMARALPTTRSQDPWKAAKDGSEAFGGKAVTNSPYNVQSTAVTTHGTGYGGATTNDVLKNMDSANEMEKQAAVAQGKAQQTTAIANKFAADKRIEADEQQMRLQMEQKKALDESIQTYNNRSAQSLQTLYDAHETKVDPRRYIDNMSTGQKVFSGIGMVLAGFGGADAVVKAHSFIDKAVNDDIAAQESNRRAAMTGAVAELDQHNRGIAAASNYFDKIGAWNTAQQATRWDAIASYLDRAKNSPAVADPTVKANVASLLAVAQQKKSAAIQGLIQAGTSTAVQTQQGLWGKVIPSMNLASGTMPTDKNKDDMEKTNELEGNLQTALTNYRDTVDKYGTMNVKPNYAQGQIDSKRAAIDASLKAMEDLGRITPQTTALIKSQIPEITGVAAGLNPLNTRQRGLGQLDAQIEASKDRQAQAGIKNNYLFKQELAPALYERQQKIQAGGGSPTGITPIPDPKNIPGRAPALPRSGEKNTPEDRSGEITWMQDAAGIRPVETRLLDKFMKHFPKAKVYTGKPPALPKDFKFSRDK